MEKASSLGTYLALRPEGPAVAEATAAAKYHELRAMRAAIRDTIFEFEGSPEVQGSRKRRNDCMRSRSPVCYSQKERRSDGDVADDLTELSAPGL